jgi:hypothetical protein
MTSIDEEKNAAEGADNFIRNLSVSAVPSDVEVIVQTLRKANDAAITAAGMSLLTHKELNNARGEVAIALSALIDELNRTSLTQDVIDRARRAVEDWKIKLSMAEH